MSEVGGAQMTRPKLVGARGMSPDRAPRIAIVNRFRALGRGASGKGAFSPSTKTHTIAPAPKPLAVQGIWYCITKMPPATLEDST